MFRIIILKIILMGIIFSQYSPYIIYTSEDFHLAAQNIADLHENIIPQISDLEPLDTEIIYKENKGINEFMSYLNTYDIDCNEFITEPECNENSLCKWDSGESCKNISKYLLIIGDETIINSISSSTTCGLNSYSDDLFNPDFNIGRLVVNNLDDAINQVNKLILYNTNFESGTWKNKLLLIADDNNNPSNPNSITELNHTLNTSSIYTKLQDDILIQTIYAEEFSNQAEITNNIINSINSGMGLINYIGHGTDESLAHELIIKMDRDLDLISTNNKPPIWVVGTCSFGKYINNTCMAEELMKKEDAAIAIISTSDGIPASTNNTYLNAFYDKIQEYIYGSNFRLGDAFKLAKSEFSNQECTPYKFQLFGDPALPFKFHKKLNNIIDRPNDIIIGDFNQIEINNQYNDVHHFRVSAPNIISQVGNSEYEKPGQILFEGTSYGNYINFLTPIDAIYNQAKIFILSENISSINNNFIQVESNLNLNLNLDNDLLNDLVGPEIFVYHNDIELKNNSSIFSPFSFKVEFRDRLPINLSGFNFHFLKFWIDDRIDDQIILNNFPFTATSDTSGYINFSLDDSYFKNQNHLINIEGWDILNNRSEINFNLQILNETSDLIFDVFNLPNPFRNKTFFTFKMKKPEPINIHLRILDKNGRELKKINETKSEAQSYHVIPNNGWDGIDKYNQKLKNGTYFYLLEVTNKKNELLHSKIHKFSIIK